MTGCNKIFLFFTTILLAAMSYDWLNNLYTPLQAAAITTISMILFVLIATQIIKRLP
jgi:hypothetical protein